MNNMKQVVKEVSVLEKRAITKEVNILERSDIEQALSRQFGQAVSISEVACVLTYFIDKDSFEFDRMTLDFTVNENTCDSIDLFSNAEGGYHYIEGKRLCLDEPWLSKEDIFAFDISLFKCFDTCVEFCWSESSFMEAKHDS